MHYPGNYGYIPNTLSGDGDPLDALLITEYPLHPDTIIKTKIIGVLVTKDESGQDEKIICVPHDKVDSRFSSINTLSDLTENVLQKIKHFFTHYKDNDKNKWVIVEKFLEKEDALIILKDSIERKKNNI
jgi:inorganic pyrophosphatase